MSFSERAWLELSNDRHLLAQGDIGLSGISLNIILEGYGKPFSSLRPIMASCIKLSTSDVQVLATHFKNLSPKLNLRYHTFAS